MTAANCWDFSETEAETARLEALDLCRIMDTPREPMFDQVVFTLAQIFRAPLALIAVVGRGRSCTKAAVGPDSADWARAVAFGTMAAGQDDILVVEDLQADARLGQTRGQPQGMALRFAAGIPVHGPEGHRIGALCVIDGRTRPMSSRQMISLRQLANQVTDLVQLRAPLRQLN